MAVYSANLDVSRHVIFTHHTGSDLTFIRSVTRPSQLVAGVPRRGKAALIGT